MHNNYKGSGLGLGGHLVSYCLVQQFEFWCHPLCIICLLFTHFFVDCFVHLRHYLIIFVVSTFNRNLHLALASAIIAPLGVNAHQLLLYLEKVCCNFNKNHVGNCFQCSSNYTNLLWFYLNEPSQFSQRRFLVKSKSILRKPFEQ